MLFRSFDECDILVVGGGAAGHSAAIAAARAGAKNIILLERYGYMGGLVTGGYVLVIPILTYCGKPYVRGIQEEWLTRLEKTPGAVMMPDDSIIGSDKADDVAGWDGYVDAISYDPSRPREVVKSAYLEPNELKIEMDKMILEQEGKIRLYLHSWGTEPIMDGDTIKGVIFESKEGRKAILAKYVIDATGDGDLYAQAGAPFFDSKDNASRVSKTALVYRVGGVDYKTYAKWFISAKNVFGAQNAGLADKIGFNTFALTTNSNNMTWHNNFLVGLNCIDVKDLTATEMRVRTTIHEVLEHYRKNIPGYENAYLYDIAPQTGTRCSRRLDGEYFMTPEDFKVQKQHDDVIAWHCTISRENFNAPVEIPYRAILPKKVENLLAPGRHLSADEVAIDWLLLIPQCVGTGQAAGVAAAVACEENTTLRDVNIKKVQKILTEQNVPLPRMANTDPEMEELAKYGYSSSKEAQSGKPSTH